MRMKDRLECYIDGYSRVNIYIIKDFYGGLSQSFHLKDEEGNLIPLTILNREDKGTHYAYSCAIDGEIEAGRDYLLYEEHAQYCPAAWSHIVKTKEFADKYVPDETKLGCDYTPKRTVFTTWAPTAVFVEVVLHEKEGDRVLDMERQDKGIWTLQDDEDLQGTHYNYRLKVNGVIRDTVDPYNPFTGVNTYCSSVNSLEALGLPEKIKLEEMKSSTDAIIYEASIRDISSQKDNGFTHPKTFEAFGEINDITKAKRTGLAYIKELGVTHVQIMPVFDFGSVDEEYPSLYYNWGYDPMHYRALEGSYSTDPKDPNKRILEFANLVQDLHKQGLRVNLDLVFNHVWKKEQFALENLVPDYYFLMDANGNYFNGSFYGNDIDSRPEMSRRYFLETCRMLVEDFDVDGFRFDLMGVLDYGLLNDIAKMAKSIKPDFMIYGEGWDMPSYVPPELRASQNNQAKMPLVGQFSDTFREVIRGSNDRLENPGFSNGNTGRIHEAASVMKASVPDNRFDAPFKAVNYVECHDNHTMWDKNRAVCFGAPRSERMKKQTLATAMVLLAQGVPFIHSGQEFGRTKLNLGNTYNRSDNFNRIDYRRRDEFELLVDQFKQLVKIRRAHPSLRLDTVEKVRNQVSTETINDTVLVYRTWDEQESLVMFFNPSSQNFSYHLERQADVLFDSGQSNPKRAQTVSIAPFSVVVCQLA